MMVSKCPNCGGSDLYRSVQTTPASGLFGPNLLPKLSPGWFRVGLQGLRADEAVCEHR